MEEMGSALRPVQGNPPGLIPQRSIPDTWWGAEEREKRDTKGGWRKRDLPSARYRATPPGLIPQRSIPDTWRRAEERERKEGYGRWMEEEGSALRPVQGNPPGLIPRGSIPDTRRRAEEKEEKGFRYTIIFIYL